MATWRGSRASLAWTPIWSCWRRPARKLFPGTFTHDQCENIVGARFQQKYGKRFEEKTVLCRAEGRKGEGFLVVLFPYKTDEEKPKVEPWANGAGAKITWKNETHFVLLDTVDREINADGVQGKASAFVFKTAGGKPQSLCLLTAGAVAAAGVKPVVATALPGAVQP